jgi:hypothetical protein
MTGRVALALALLGPPVVGLIAPVVSLFRFRAASARGRPSALAAVGALVVWLALSAGATVLFQQVAFGYAWGWAHARQPVLLGEEMTLLGIICGGLLLLSGCGVVLHRLIRT